MKKFKHTNEELEWAKIQAEKKKKKKFDDIHEDTQGLIDKSLLHE
jgi:hypothetical protein